MKFNILSIDGGGLRGLVPLIMLERVLQLAGKTSVSECFDLIAGTSTGGIIACALSLKDKNGEHTYTIESIKDLYINNGSKIFNKETSSVIPYFYPKYRTDGFYQVLGEFFKDYKLSDCKTPLLISAYEISSFKPYYYVSRSLNPTSNYEKERINFNLTEICKSTSAAPTYFPSHHFTVLDNQNQSQSTLHHIDGGVFINNPSLAALTEVLSNSNDSFYKKLNKAAIELNNIHVLSLGTGFSAKSISEKQGRKWGQIKWAKNLFDIMMQGNSQEVHNQIKAILKKENYLRLNILLDKESSEMDDSTKLTRETIIKLINKNIINNQMETDRIVKYLTDAGII